MAMGCVPGSVTIGSNHKGKAAFKFETPKAARQLRAYQPGKTQMDDRENTPGLKVIDGGKGSKKGTRLGHNATGTGLTEKQERFTVLLSEGATNAEAYRQAYDTANMVPNTIYSEACKLAANPKITARLNAILEEKKGRNSMATLKASERVWKNVWRLAEGDNVPPSVQQAALALAAKMAGMLTEQVRVENVSADSKSIEQELLERLQRLTA
jgi:hypothetical protein